MRDDILCPLSSVRTLIKHQLFSSWHFLCLSIVDRRGLTQSNKVHHPCQGAQSGTRYLRSIQGKVFQIWQKHSFKLNWFS